MDRTRAALALAAVGEAVTGAVLVASPSIVVELLLGAPIAGVAVVVSRIAGIALIALGWACYPGRQTDHALSGMLTYTTLAALYLLYVGISGMAGRLLWPAVAVHVMLMIVLGRAWLDARNVTEA